jgi:AraC family transcriptional regulator of adaptative response / DNA-3-methyladenine glycosylase II
VYALSPTDLRKRAKKIGAGRAGARRLEAGTNSAGAIPVRLAYRPPLDLRALLEFLGQRAIPGVESFDGHVYARTLNLPYGSGIVTIAVGDGDNPTPGPVRYDRPGTLQCELRLQDVRDFATAVSRVRRLLDLDADPLAVRSALHDDPLLGRSVESKPGLRVPGAVDGAEIAVRAVLGQQVSVAGARTLGDRLASLYGAALPEPFGALDRLFPSAEALAAADPSTWPLPAGRARALQALTRAIAAGDISIDPGTDRDSTEAALRALPGVGPWTASYIRMRGLGDPDVFLGQDLGIKKAIRAWGEPVISALWKPWRSYATFHLWTTSANSHHPTT